ncbi:MAG: hypothetical protein ACHQ53_18120 [Polyangiales bacterium]
MALQPDYRDILVAFGDHAVEYLVVGGYAVGFHGQPRFTKDLDLWVRPTPENLSKVRAALVAFGAPQSVLLQLEQATLEDVLWMGVPPVRIDIVKGVPGGDFDRAYPRRVTADWDGVRVDVVGRDDLISLKRESGRPQDLLDADALEHGTRED